MGVIFHLLACTGGVLLEPDYTARKIVYLEGRTVNRLTLTTLTEFVQRITPKDCRVVWHGAEFWTVFVALALKTPLLITEIG